MHRFFLFLCLIPFVLSALTHVPPEQIEQQLAEAEAQYEHALKLFNPWYTGPLLAPSATMMPPGQGNLQPYIFFTDNYGAFNSKREWVSAPNKFILNPQPCGLQLGVTPSMDTTINMSTVAQWKDGHCGGGFQDMSLALGFKIQGQTLHIPKVKFTVNQSFPTGKYQNLDPDKLGLDALGAGSWQTTFALALGKLLFYDTLHPFNTRLSLKYTIPSAIEVRNFNAYGGGYGTRGTVHPGNSFAADLGLELSINQPWVATIDIVYNCSNKTTFSGNPGTTTKGGSTPASNTSGYSDQLSLAPGIEYNWNENMGILWGVWFTVYGRNASNFVSGIFSWTWVFP